jgi:hypothetical protein
MNKQRQPISINSSAIAVAGVGGLGMIALVVIIAATFAIARFLLFGGLVGGVILAATLMMRRRHRQLGEPRGDLPIVLFATRVQRLDPKGDTMSEDRRSIVREPRQQLAISET